MTKGSSDADSQTEGGTAPAPSAPDAPAPATETSGLDAALTRLRAEFGDDVVTLWRTSGPRKSHTDEVACVLAEIGDHPRKLVIQSFASGAFKVFAEVGGKSPDQMIEGLRTQFETF